MQQTKDEKKLFGAIEAILFVAGEAVLLEELSNALCVTDTELETLLNRMKQAMEEQERGDRTVLLR